MLDFSMTGNHVEEEEEEEEACGESKQSKAVVSATTRGGANQSPSPVFVLFSPHIEDTAKENMTQLE